MRDAADRLSYEAFRRWIDEEGSVVDDVRHPPPRPINEFQSASTHPNAVCFVKFRFKWISMSADGSQVTVIVVWLQAS